MRRDMKHGSLTLVKEAFRYKILFTGLDNRTNQRSIKYFIDRCTNRFRTISE